MDYESIFEKLDRYFYQVDRLIEEFKRKQDINKKGMELTGSTSFEEQQKASESLFLFAELAGIIINLYDLELIILDMKKSIKLLKKD